MTTTVRSRKSFNELSLGKEAGLTWTELLIAVAIIAILLTAVALGLRSCPRRNFSAATTVSQQIQPLMNQLLTSDDVSPKDFGDAADKIARAVIENGLNKDFDKETLKAWFDEIIRQLTERKNKASAGKEKLKLEKAIEAVTKAYNELVK